MTKPTQLNNVLVNTTINHHLIFCIDLYSCITAHKGALYHSSSLGIVDIFYGYIMIIAVVMCGDNTIILRQLRSRFTLAGTTWLLWRYDCFTVSLHSPYGRHLPAVGAVQGHCQMPLKNGWNSHQSHEHRMRCDWGFPKLYLDQQITGIGLCSSLQRGKTATSVAITRKAPDVVVVRGTTNCDQGSC